MGLAIAAEVIRDLIVDGEYLLDYLEPREHGRVLLALSLRSRTQPYSIQLETTETKLAGLFRAFLNGQAAGAASRPDVRVGSQAVPVLEVGDLPADQPKRRRPRQPPAEPAPPEIAESQPRRAGRRRRAARQLSPAAVPSSAPTPSARGKPGEPSASSPARRNGERS
jgi:hypothetical protein